MKKVFILFLAPLCLGLMGIGPFPGDGYPNPDAEGVSGHGLALSYTDNGNGTFTDNRTKFVWEIKTDNDSIHDKDNRYTWTIDTTVPTGILFTDFLDILNETCEGEDVTVCESNKDCAKGSKCGFAGYTDWCIPNVKQLQSIVDYSTSLPSSSVPGETESTDYWSATTFHLSVSSAYTVNFGGGIVFVVNKVASKFARAVRPCS